MKPGWIVLGVLAIVWSGVANAQPARWQDEAERRLSDIRERAGAELGDPAVQRELKPDLDGMLTVMGKLGSPRDENLLLDIAETRRILTIATTAPDAEAADWYRYLADESKLGRTLAFVRSPEDEPVGVIRVLRELRDEFGDSALDEFPELVAAICVVHDGEELFARQVNENRPRTPGVVPLFDFFSANEDRMLFGVREVPAELLIYVVDIVGDIEEFEWALDNYEGDQLVGRLFRDIEYDREHAENGTPKDVTRHGYTLPGIQQFGGVCADQAHFAVTVGKSIGVPTAYVTAVGGEVGHAWVGFLQAEGRNAFWNLNIGRYDEYQGVVGDVLDPQTRSTIGDDELSLLSKLTRVNRNQRFEAAAWLDTAALLQRGARTIDVGQSRSRTTPREGQAGVLELAERSLRKNPADRRGWNIVRTAFADPDMPMDDRTRWSQIIIRLCQEANAEQFLVSMFKPMIESMEDPRARITAWERALGAVRTKKDVRARIRMLQAEEFKKQGDNHRAFLAYQDVVDTSLNDTRESQYAVSAAVAMLEESGKHAEAARFLTSVLARLESPRYAEPFESSSNYNVIRRLAANYSVKHNVSIGGSG